MEDSHNDRQSGLSRPTEDYTLEILKLLHSYIREGVSEAFVLQRISESTRTRTHSSYVVTPVLCLRLLINNDALSGLFPNWNQFG